MQTLTHAWLALMIDVSIKSLALAMLAGVGLAALRVRDTNLRHRVWMAVLLGMLLLPALVHVTPAVPLPRWMTVAMLAESQQPIAAEENVDRAPNHIPPTGAVAINEVVYSNDSAPGPFTDPLATTPQNALNTPRLSANRSEPQSGLIAAGKPSTKPVSARAVAPDQLLPILEIAYLCVAVAFAARLMIGLFLTRRLVAPARGITDKPQLPLADASGFQCLFNGGWRIGSSTRKRG
jgi:hypothetical protein